MTTIYAVCEHCAHVEPRPAHAESDWSDCEHCGAANPTLARDPDRAFEISDEVVHAVPIGHLERADLFAGVRVPGTMRTV